MAVSLSRAAALAFSSSAFSSGEAPRAELLLPTCTQQVRELYQQVTPLCGARWLMIRITDAQVLADVKQFIRLRVAPKE